MVEKIFYEEVLKGVTTDNSYSIIYNFVSDQRQVYVSDKLLNLFEYDLIRFNQFKKKGKELNKDIENEDFDFYSSFPTLIVKDEKLFNKKLNEYINTMFECSEDIKNKDKHDESKIKYYLYILMLNATSYDFQNPIQYIDKVISFQRDRELEHLNEPQEFEVKLLKNNIKYEIVRNPVGESTPFSFLSSLTNNVNGIDYVYHLPNIRYGINEENGEKVVYIYTTQQEKKNNMKNSYMKAINDYLFKVNKGLPNYEDILTLNHNSIVALTTFLSVLHNEGFSKFKIPALILARQSSALLKLEKASEALKRMGDDVDTYDTILYNEQKLLGEQKRLMDKFMLNFISLDCQFPNMNIKSFPFENNENCLIFEMKSLECNNQILSDICNTISEKHNERKNTRRI